MAEICECGNDKFKVFKDSKFKHIWITCSVCGKQKEMVKELIRLNTKPYNPISQLR